MFVSNMTGEGLTILIRPFQNVGILEKMDIPDTHAFL